MRNFFIVFLSALFFWQICAQQGEVVNQNHDVVQSSEIVKGAAQPETSHVVPQNNSDALAEKKASHAIIPQTPALPAPPVMAGAENIQAEKAPVADVETIDVEKGKGFDTLGLEKPEGNWLIKRIWWEKAEVRYEKIKVLVDQTMDMRMSFFAQRNEIENKILSPFYIQTSLNQGQLEEVTSFLLDELRRQREKEKGLSDAERQLYETLTAEEPALQQLNFDVEAVRKLDVALDDSLTKLMEQIDLCRSYEKQSWIAFKDIAKVLDHDKARTLYYSMDTYLSNIKAINNYIQGAFTQHFNEIINTIKQNVDRIKNAMSSLKEKGIDLRKQVKILEEQELALIQKKEEREPVRSKQVEADSEAEEEPQGWFSWILTSIANFFSGIWDLIAFWR